MVDSLSKSVGCFVLIVWISSGWLFAQNELRPYKKLDQYNFDHWKSEDGLPVNSIIHIIQAKSGYIWFVSYGGITRFNGIEFYTFNSFNAPEIINNSYTHIYEDKAGVIWAASSGGGVTSIDGEKVRTYTTEHGLPSNFVEEIVQDTTGRIWVATSNGLYYQKGESFINDNTPEELKSKELKSITCDENNHIWAGTVDTGVFRFSGSDIVGRYTVEQGLVSNIINYVKAEKSSIWVGTDMGLSVIRADSTIENITIDDGLQNNYVTSSVVDNNGVIWVGSYKGFSRINEGEFSHFSTSHPLFGQDITSIASDREGNLWLGTYRNGLYKLWDGKFTNYSSLMSNEHGSYVVHGILQKTDSTFIVIQQDGINLLNINDNSFERFDLNYDVPVTSFKSGMLDSKGNLWVSTLNFLLKYKEGKSKLYTTKNGLIHDNVRLTYEDSKGNIWVGTTNGITVISEEKFKYYSVKDGLSHEYIMSIEEDSAGVIWVGTRNGLNRFDHGRFTSYFAKDGMAGDFVFKTYFDDHGAMWLCGNAGLTRYKNGEFTGLTTAQGLVSNTVFQILEDDQGYFWITTNQKNITVFKVSEQELNDLADGKISWVDPVVYSQKDGLKSTAATSSATSLKAPDGTLYLATNNGIESIDPSNIKINDGKPPVVIEEFFVDGNEIGLDSSISIPSGKQRITIKFSALSYVSPENIEYKYKLIGFDDQWQNAKAKRETSYTNLPYGRYTFKVVAANSDGVWNDDGVSVSFYIKPAFYETNIFIAGTLLLIVLVGVLVYNLRIKSLKRAQYELARLVDERTSEVVHQKEEIEAQKEAIEVQQEQIEYKNRELHKINLHLEDLVEERTEQLKKAYKDLLSVNKELDTFIYRSVHDVRGPIARLQGLSYLISLETTDDRILELVNLLNQTANEMNDVFYRLLNIVRLKAAELNINEIDIEQVIDKVLKRLLPEGSKVVDIQIEISNDFRLYSDKDTVEIILYHLLENALKFRKDHGTHKVKVNCNRKDKNNASIEVTDNGTGISKNVADKIFDMFFVGQDNIRGTGLGLYTAQTAAKVLRGKVKLVKSDEAGTTFEVILPGNIT
ncbi:ATP-binding protein [Fulvivirga ulvae]|uniref:sensor histidine kinase n=1 Tax=Fulvivirga ulvae TaxID=2904245 RepID=UPI001F356A27|nr:sensor histidine kinase [Fulvivirga ulvae]UII30334.1 ATP-binding protein [Fulvivirga ulvae]